MMNYLFPKISYYNNIERQKNTFIPHRKLKKNEIALYNKNSMNYSYWKVLEESLTHDGIIIKRGNCPKYWSGVIRIK